MIRDFSVSRYRWRGGRGALAERGVTWIRCEFLKDCAMWKLQPTESESGAFNLLPGKEYVVGRKNCDILLANDQSISRVHAHLTVTEQSVVVKDSSKYGTFVNDEQLAAGSTKTLHVGDRITFGVFQSKFRLELNSVVVCSSCVDNEGKRALSQAIQCVGGHLVNSWSQDCTHLVMPTVKVTIKTICALLSCRPIVKPEFFTEFQKAVQQKETLPKTEDFKPEIDEPSLTKQDVDLSSRPERKSVFRDKTFVFLNAKQMKRLSQAISCGGGSSQLLEEGSLPLSLLESTGTCVVDVGTGSSQAFVTPTMKKWVDSVGQILHRNGLRFIMESEIGLAAIYVSNLTYCNPCSAEHPDSVRVRSAIPEATLTQNATVEETVLPAVSQNITAYVVNTEPSQNVSRLDALGATSVGETPEKRPVECNPPSSTRPSSKLSQRQPSAVRPNTTSDSMKTTFGSSESLLEKKKAESALLDRRNDTSVKCPAPPNSTGTAALKKSPQKQSALTSFFQPVSKKRLREGSPNLELSEAKLSKRECKDEEDKTKQARLASSVQSSHMDQNFSASLGLGFGPGMSSGPSGGHQVQNCDSSLSGSKKRKEPTQDQPSGSEVPAEKDDLDVSLEELESIMSMDMDEPVQSAANKKQRVDYGESSAASKEDDSKQYSNTTSSNQQRAKKQQKTATKGQDLEQDRPRARNHQDSERVPQTSNRATDVERGESSSGHRKDGMESEDVKEEEISFVVTSKVHKGFSEDMKVETLKQESKNSASCSENDSELPRRLLQIQFKSLTVSAPFRTRSEPLQSRNPNHKNFKRFRKMPVPGLQGLPNIIGGSDLVAHTRSKNPELEEWLRDAAEEEKRQEQEVTLGDDLFRYNPRSSKRR
ncbi:nibrin isoform X2 [Hoplias malabaricus]|uniref:nibrin isoform X2 n=1 Tax=Hoplias malabaricus TaxID=27720 RepID=UPI003462BD5D